MTEKNREKKRIEKKGEIRMKEIAKMISEGGLGADKYYDIQKDHTSEKKVNN